MAVASRQRHCPDVPFRMVVGYFEFSAGNWSQNTMTLRSHPRVIAVFYWVSRAAYRMTRQRVTRLRSFYNSIDAIRVCQDFRKINPHESIGLGSALGDWRRVGESNPGGWLRPPNASQACPVPTLEVLSKHHLRESRVAQWSASRTGKSWVQSAVPIWIRRFAGGHYTLEFPWEYV